MAPQQKQHNYSCGDQVRHPKRPEWGTGTVRQAQSVTHEGQQAQRLAVDFPNRGRVVINTAIAPLQPTGGPGTESSFTEDKEKAQTMTRTQSNPRNFTTSAGAGWLEQLERATQNSSHELWQLPDAMTDPFASSRSRLHATLDSYRFSTDARSLIEWASGQTGLNDPMTRYTRQELEQAFPRFARDRDQHLAGLVRQLKRSGEQHLLNEALQATRHPAARTALAKAIRS